MTLSEFTQAWRSRGAHLQIEGKQIFVYERGTRDKPVVLFIHGFPTSGHDWWRVADQLSDEYRCIALDLPGFGLSDKPVFYSYSLFQQADVVEGLARILEFDAAHVVSHDMGTSVHAELLARKQRSELSFEIMTSTFLNGSLVKGMAQLTEFQEMLETPSRLKDAAARCAVMLPSYVQSLQRLMEDPSVVSDEDAVVMTDLLRYNDGHLRLPNIYAHVRERYLIGPMWLESLVAETNPIQLVWGIEDTIAVVDMARTLAAKMPSAQLTELPGVGHFVPVEAPSAVAASIRAIAPTGHERSEQARFA